eukprot:4259924-Amphidinium_carterae.1
MRASWSTLSRQEIATSMINWLRRARLVTWLLQNHAGWFWETVSMAIVVKYFWEDHLYVKCYAV